MSTTPPATTPPINLAHFVALAKLSGRYQLQLGRLQGSGIVTQPIEDAVDGTMANLKSAPTSAFVIYGEPQSGKTEMMICLTARLLDEGHPVVVHLMNDSVDLLTQNLKRFKQSGLAPAARVFSELPAAGSPLPNELVVFCKKNVNDLDKLIARFTQGGIGNVVVVDDEADFATPNGNVNQGLVTAINQRVATLLSASGIYIGVTATPARLDLNNTFNNKTEKWVQFKPHARYHGWDVFFPLKLTSIPYRLTRLTGSGSPADATSALVRFLVTAAYLNKYKYPTEQNWTMLVHTSGKRSDHRADQQVIEQCVAALLDPNDPGFAQLVTQVYTVAKQLYPAADPNVITAYVVQNASRTALTVLNSERDRLGDSATEPTSPFTIIIGGNIVSRGVTFPNLLAMFFTRDVKTKLQQDTYIQRARMFGARGGYLAHFELTIPSALYNDWRKCFLFHKLALETIKSNLGAPVWLGSSRVSVAASASIDRSTVVLDKGEMSFKVFKFDPALDALVRSGPSDIATLVKMQGVVGNECLPQFLIEYIRDVEPNGVGSLAIHTAGTIDGRAGADQTEVSRTKGFIGQSQLEQAKFPDAAHHVKIFYSAQTGNARVFYKYTADSAQFIKNKP